MVYIICNMCVMMTEIKAIESGKKNALLGRANIKKNYDYNKPGKPGLEIIKVGHTA